MNNYRKNGGASRNGFIELCRFILALCVVSHHALFLDNPGHIPLFGGYIAVEFFFILTGFFLAYGVDRENENSDHYSASHTKKLYAFDQVAKRIGKIYPYFLTTWGASFVIYRVINHEGLKTLLWDLLRGVPQLLLLSMAGLGGASEGLWDYVGTGWYLSALVISILIVYPFLYRFKMSFCAGIAPVADEV